MRWAQSIKRSKRDQRGVSLVELLIAMTIFVLASAGITFLVIDALQSERRSSEQREAMYLTQEGYEAAIAIRNRGWKYLTLGTHGITITGGSWEFSGSSSTTGKYTRAITVSPVERDSGGNIVASGGASDSDTKRVLVETTWDFSPLRTGQSSFVTYLTNWRSKRWLQFSQGDFDAGTKTNIATTNNDDGEFQLAQGAGAPWGNEFLLDSTSSVGALSSQQRMSSLRFTAQHSKTVTEIQVYLNNESGLSPTYRYGLRADTAGLPDASWLGASQQGYGDLQATSAGWKTIPLLEPVDLTAGEVYHIVVAWQSGTVSGSRNVGLRRSTPNTQRVAFDNGIDNAANTLFSTNAGASWTAQGFQPLYLLRFSDATFEGNPWISTTSMQVNGNRRVGEQFTPSSDLTVTGVSFEVRKSAAATPGADLTVSLSQVGGGIIASGTLVSRTTITMTYAAYTYSFPTPVTLSAGVSYRLFLSSQGSNNPFYQVRQLTATNAQEYVGITFQGSSALYTISTNGGTTWTQASNADVGGFTLTTQSGYATIGDLISQPFDTGSTTTEYNDLRWDATIPAGTVEFQIRTADTEVNLGGASWVGPGGTGATRFSVSGQATTTAAGASGTRWIQWRAYLTGNQASTPSISDVTITYEP